jgi:putative membrane protein
MVFYWRPKFFIQQKNFGPMLSHSKKLHFKPSSVIGNCLSKTRVNNRTKHLKYLFWVLLCVYLPACTMLSDPPVPPETDKQFLLSASDLNILCKTAGDIALVNAKNSLVRQYAAGLVDFSSALDRELSVMSRQKGIPGKEMSETNVKQMEMLRAKSTESFDPTFVEMTITAQNELVTLYESQIQSGRDQGVRRWAEAKLPAIRQSLDNARLARKSM